MSVEQSDLPGPLKLDTARGEVTYHRSEDESSLTPAPLLPSGTDDETRPRQTPTTSKNRRNTGKCCSCSKRKAFIIGFCVLACFGLSCYLFSSSSSDPTTTFAPKAPMAPDAPAPPMEPPRPTGPVDPICHPLNIPEAFYNGTGRFPEEGLYFLPCVNAFRFNVDLMTQVKNRMEEGVWDRENPSKLPVGGEDAYKKYSIEYALALARDTNVTYEELDGYWGKEYNKVKCFAISKVNDPLPGTIPDCSWEQAVYTDMATDADRAIFPYHPEYFLHYTQCRVILFALVFGEFKSAMPLVSNITAGREHRFYFVETFFPLVERNDRAGLVDFINGVGLDSKQAIEWAKIIKRPADGFAKRLEACMRKFNPIPGQSLVDCIITAEERQRIENIDRNWWGKGYVDGRGEVDPRASANGRGKRHFDDYDYERGRRDFEDDDADL